MKKRALRLAGLITLASLTAAAGCKRGGQGADGPGGAGGPGGASSDAASREQLQERAKKVIRLQGGMLFETLVHYEGGPKESWVVMSHEGRPMQPDLEVKPGAGDRDDTEATPVAPAAGAWSVPLRVPEWCDAYDGVGQRMNLKEMEKGFLATDEAGAYVEDLRLAGIAGCDRLKYAPRQRRVQALLQAFVNKTGVKRDELVSMLKVLVAPPKPETDRILYSCGATPVVRQLLCGPGMVKADPSTGGYKGNKDEKGQIDRLDELERTAAVDDAARLSLVLGDIVAFEPQSFSSTYPGHGVGSLKVVPGGRVEAERHGLGRTDMHAVLALDVEKISFTELSLSLVAGETDPVVRFILLRRLEDVERVMKAELAKVPADARAKAAAGMEAWQTAYKANKADMDAAYKAIAAPTDAEACGQVDAAFGRLLKAKAPKSLKDAYAAALDPAVNVVLGARETCHRTRGWTSMALWEGKILAATRSHVGPRRAAVMAFRPGKAPDRLTYLPDEQIVKATKAAAPGVQIDFMPKEWLEERENCVETNRVDRITSDGHIVYRTNCTALPPIKHSEPYPPASVDAASGAALKKGNVVIMIRQKDVPEVLFSAHTDEKSFEADQGLRVFLGVPLL